MPNWLVNKGECIIDARVGQPTADELVDAPQDYAVNLIMSHVGEGNEVKCVVWWYRYILPDDTFEELKHIFEYFNTR